MDGMERRSLLLPLSMLEPVLTVQLWQILVGMGLRASQGTGGSSSSVLMPGTNSW